MLVCMSAEIWVLAHDFDLPKEEPKGWVPLGPPTWKPTSASLLEETGLPGPREGILPTIMEVDMGPQKASSLPEPCCRLP